MQAVPNQDQRPADQWEALQAERPFAFGDLDEEPATGGGYVVFTEPPVDPWAPLRRRPVTELGRTSSHRAAHELIDALRPYRGAAIMYADHFDQGVEAGRIEVAR